MTTETATAALPEATPEVLARIAAFLADHGVELRVSPGGELQLRDVDQRLSPHDRSIVRDYADALADWLAKSEETDNQLEAIEAETKSITSPDLATLRCDRCNHGEFDDFEIHDGKSIRRDCARCGRTLGLPKWYGKEYQIDDV